MELEDQLTITTDVQLKNNISSDVFGRSFNVINKSIVESLAPVFENILRQSADRRRKGNLTYDQRTKIRAYLLEKERGKVRSRRESKKRFR